MNTMLSQQEQQRLFAIWKRSHYLPSLGYLCRHRTRGFEADPVMFPMIRKSWDLALAGKSTSEIVVQMNDREGFRTPLKGKTGGKPLSRSVLGKILRDPIYMGRFTWHGEQFRGFHEPMVTEEEFERVQVMLSERRKR